MIKNVVNLFKQIMKTFEIVMNDRSKPVLMNLFKNVQTLILKHPLSMINMSSLCFNAATLIIQKLNKKRLIEIIK